MEVQCKKYIKERGYNRRCSKYFEAGWKEALQWIKRELHAARDGFEPDLGLHNLLRRKLGEEYNRKT